MNFTDAKDQFKDKFGNLSTEQLWVLVKFAKHVRLRCRNNTAFNNYMSSTFPYASFTQVSKTSKSGKSYMGLQINNVDQEDE